MDRELRSWIGGILEADKPLLAIAVRQRAKFEGWLKFELALYAAEHGPSDVQVESASEDGGRSDLSFVYAGTAYAVELKTYNTNYRMSGVLDCTRPITTNMDSVVVDGRKLQHCPGQGIVAFCHVPGSVSGSPLDGLPRPDRLRAERRIVPDAAHKPRLGSAGRRQ